MEPLNLPLLGIGNPADAAKKNTQAKLKGRAKVIWDVITTLDSARRLLNEADKNPNPSVEEIADRFERYFQGRFNRRFRRLVNQTTEAVTAGDQDGTVELLPVWNRDP